LRTPGPFVQQDVRALLAAFNDFELAVKVATLERLVRKLQER
jgi:hypothetical protein